MPADNGWGRAQVNLPGARMVENVIALPRSADEPRYPFNGLLAVGAQSPPDGMYVAFSGRDVAVLPSPLMLDKPPV